MMLQPQPPQQNQRHRQQYSQRHWWIITFATILPLNYLANGNVQTDIATKCTSRFRSRQPPSSESLSFAFVPPKLTTKNQVLKYSIYQQYHYCSLYKSLYRSAATKVLDNSSRRCLAASDVTKELSYQSLENIYRFRGIVDTGYGRGGKKLGFPTANLGPASYFHEYVLTNLSTGVYFGYATIEGMDLLTINNTVPLYKAVVNIGYSPTFVDEENKVKIIEAHLIDDGKDQTTSTSTPTIPSDFYHKTIRLQLIGYIRPEMKFACFPDLIKQITNDVQTAKELLTDDSYNFTLYQSDPFVLQHDTDKSIWIGKNGGNETASWEMILKQ